LCEIGHKIEKICENFAEITEAEKKKIQMKKNVVLRHKLINKETKEQFQHLMDNLKEGQGILTIDFRKYYYGQRAQGAWAKLVHLGEKNDFWNGTL
jgi:hypothetical protein